MHKFALVTALGLGAIHLATAASPALAQTPQKPPHQTYVPARQTTMSHLKAAAQGPVKAAGTFDGRRGASSKPVQVTTPTRPVNAATIAKQQNAAERVRQAQTSRKYGIDKSRVP